jgi:pyruvate/2-oxoglutarate dehydrogenase complex dihydrolipoamide dehydrogenase (E3) component
VFVPSVILEKPIMAGNNGYDVLIIGGGQAGIPLAHSLANVGKRVALAERKRLGGSCVNFGCTPTKAAIASARVARLARRGAEFGLNIPIVSVNFLAVLKRASDILNLSRKSLDQGFENSENPRLLRGHARIEGRVGNEFLVRIGDELVTAEQLVLNTGTRSLIPSIEGLDSVDFIHAENWLDRPELPERLAIIGGGYIGLEMSQFYLRMGSGVIVIEEGNQIASREDEDVAAELKRLLEAEGVEFRLNVRVKRVDRHDRGLTLSLEEGAVSTQIEASHIFVAVGRKPNTDDLGLEKQIKVARFEMRKNSKARELGEPEGFIKVVVDSETDRILGAAVLATEAAELVHLYVDLMNVEAPYTVIRDAVHIHPTLAEAVQSAVSLFG